MFHLRYKIVVKEDASWASQQRVRRAVLDFSFEVGMVGFARDALVFKSGF